MEKYRKWTDEATGINPFINSKTSTVKLTTIVTSAVIAFIKINLLALLLPSLLLSLLLQDSLGSIPVLGTVLQFPLHLLNLLLGLWGVDDASFANSLNKTRGKGRLILSNGLCVLDTFYYLARIPGVRFIVSAFDEDNFQVVSGLGAVLKVLTERQPYYKAVSNAGSKKFKQLIENELAKGHSCILFYEGIRTNGKGTIKISKKLSSQVFNLQKDYSVAHLKYSSAPQSLFSLVSHPFLLFLTALGTCSISLRVRCISIPIQSQHSEVDVQKDLDNFLMANASKLLDTEPSSYFAFLDFYGKTQEAGYTQVAGQDKSD